MSSLPSDADTGRLPNNLSLMRMEARTGAGAARMLKVTRKLHRLFFRLHIFRTPEHPPGGWRAGPFGGGGRSSHPAPELTGEVYLSIAARLELRGLAGSGRAARPPGCSRRAGAMSERWPASSVQAVWADAQGRASSPAGRAGSRQRSGVSRALGRKHVQCRGKRTHHCTMGRSDPRHHQTMTRLSRREFKLAGRLPCRGAVV
jgi:hypothetical protein